MTTRIVDQPLRIARGPVDGLVLEQSLQTLRKDILRHLFTYIGDEGRARSQKLLPLVNSGGKFSSQTAQPLTASDAGSDATISIASHSVQFGFGVVAYNSGSITGLSFSTLYYVYTDDPTYAGGAVTYLATTNANNITANDGRYYVGSVTTPANGAGDTGGGWGGGGGGGGYQIP